MRRDARRLGAHSGEGRRVPCRRGKQPIEPLYSLRHSTRTIELMILCAVPTAVRRGTRSSRHVHGRRAHPRLSLGRAGLHRGQQERRLVFSGDIGRSGLPSSAIRSRRRARMSSLMESTYGNRTHESTEGARARLAAVIRETAARGGAF